MVYRLGISIAVMILVLVGNLIYDLKFSYMKKDTLVKFRDKGENDTLVEDSLLTEDYLEKNKVARKEIRHVAFLKVHKTASSTAQNIFLRFGDARNLTFMLAHTHGESTWLNVISYVNSITKENIVPPPAGQQYDILCCHVIYNRESFEKAFPEDTAYVGIVREPFSRFQSAVKYFNPKHIMQIQGDRPVSVYAKDPLKYEPVNPRNSMTNNRMAVEFGFPQKLFPGESSSSSEKEINAYLQKLDKEFKFIIISELFEESVVYMKRLLGWTMKDILYIDKNKSNPKTNPRKLVTEEDNKLLSSFLHLDIVLYDFARKKFENQLAREGEDFLEELELFKGIKEKVNNFCVEKSKRAYISFEKSKWDDAFNITRNDCKLFYMHEKDLIQRQRMRQYGTLDN